MGVVVSQLLLWRPLTPLAWPFGLLSVAAIVSLRTEMMVATESPADTTGKLIPAIDGGMEGRADKECRKGLLIHRDGGTLDSIGALP